MSLKSGKFRYFLDFEFQIFFMAIVLLDEILIPVKFQDEHRHSFGDTREWKWWFQSGCIA